MREQIIKAEIQTIYRRLVALPPKCGWQAVAPAFRDLECLIFETDADVGQAVLDDAELRAIQPRLRELRAEYEYDKERYWARHIICSPQPVVAFDRLPVYAKYDRIVALELELLETHLGRAPATVLFVGSGPLPMTPILLAHKAGIQVDALDRESEACELGRSLADALDLTHLLHFYPTDVLDFSDISRYDVTFLAALVGMEEQDKARYIRHVARYMRTEQVLVIRTAYGLGRLMYAGVNMADLASFDCMIAKRPHGDLIQAEIIATMKHYANGEL